MNTAALSALAEPNRFKIVELLRTQPRSVNEVAALLKLRQPQASKHLRALHDAGLVSMQPVAQKRLYALNKEPFLQLEDWVNSFHDHWNEQLDNLEKHLKEKS